MNESQPPAGDETPQAHRELLDQLRRDFDVELRQNRSPQIEEYLEEAPAECRLALLEQLLTIEIQHLRRRGDTLMLDAYYARFPQAAALIDRLGAPDPLHPGAGDHSDFLTPHHLGQETIPFTHHPRSVDRFELKAIIGHGSFGEVWRARDPRLERDVAIKFPRSGSVAPQDKSLFLREARVAAKLRHPNIVTVYEVAEKGNEIYIVSELINDQSLKTFLEKRRLTYCEAASLVAKLADALFHAHDHGIVHRDLKPGNILMDKAGEPHIADFGLAKRNMGGESLSVDGRVMGTPIYMSPEQTRGDNPSVDHRTDIYSLGVILYELLTGTVPFRGEISVLFEQICHRQPDRPRKLKPDVPKDLEAICLKCLEKNPDRRYASAKDVADDLHLFLGGQTLRGIPAPIYNRAWKWANRHRGYLSVTAGLILVASLFVGVMARSAAPPPPPVELRPVLFETDPPGCEITVVAIDPDTGEPDPSNIQKADGESPVVLSLAPGDYLVVAVLDDLRFHEVYRHVPETDEKVAMSHPHLYWRVDTDGVIRLRQISIPRPDLVVGMALIEEEKNLAAPKALGEERVSTYRLPAFFVDRSELLESELIGPDANEGAAASAAGEPAAQTMLSRAIAALERIGKRLPSAAESYALANTVCPNEPCVHKDDLPLYGIHSGLWEWTSTKPGGPFSGMTGFPHMEGESLLSFAPRMVSCGPQFEHIQETLRPANELDTNIGIRGVRSYRPRLSRKDFLVPVSRIPPRR